MKIIDKFREMIYNRILLKMELFEKLYKQDYVYLTNYREKHKYSLYFRIILRKMFNRYINNKYRRNKLNE